jgi:TolB protein
VNRLVAVLAAVVIAAVVSLAVPAAAERAVASDDTAGSAQARNGDIVFSGVAKRNGFFELYLIRSDGTKLRRITRNPGWERFPKWSPDGRWLAYISNRSKPGNEGAYEIYVMRPNGSGFRRVTRDRWVDDQVGWSPDGRRFVFVSSRASGRFGISVINVNGSGYRRLTRDTDDSLPAWSPDGRTIAFERLTRITDEFVTGTIWLMNPDGSNPRRLTEPPQVLGYLGARDGMPDWSPDGRLIAFTRSYRGRRDIYVIHPDGTGLRRLTKQAGLHSFPSWSPDGKRIVFVTSVGRRRSLYVMNADGTGVRRLTTGQIEYAYPDWQPLR